MKRVTSLGGIFFKCQDPKKIRDWYRDHLGLKTDDYGSNFEWRHADNPNMKGTTVWSPFKESTTYFEPSKKEFMINFRVENLEQLLKLLKEEGIEQIGEMQVYDYGKFAHIMDPEGNKIELWEAVDEEFDKMVDGNTTS
jgi:predicted enzyme related to lactoylglutathione lyase